MLEEAAIRAEWRRQVNPSWSWRRSRNQAGTLGRVPQGEGGGFYVHCSEFPKRRAYLKPLATCKPGNERAAREKIASDLAHDLGVNVPPAVLWTRTDLGADEEKHVCLSLVMSAHQAPWGSVADHVALSGPR